MFCNNCGKKNDDRTQFCHFCGQALMKDYVKLDKVLKQNGKKKALIAVLCLVVSIVAVFMLIIVGVNRTVDKHISVDNNKIIRIEETEKDEEIAIPYDENSNSHIEPDDKQQSILKREKIVTYSISAIGNEMAGTEITEYNENGNIIYLNLNEVTIYTYTYDYYENGSIAVQYTNSDEVAISEIRYDENGNSILERGQDFEYHREYEYDDKGLLHSLIEYYKYENEPEQFWRCEKYEYDENDNISRKEVYYEDMETPTWDCRWEYNENGQMLLYEEAYVYFSDAGIINRIEYNPQLYYEDEYRKYGNGDYTQLSHKEYNSEGVILSERYFGDEWQDAYYNQYAYNYEYDEYGNVIREQWYINSELYKEITREYY